MIKREKREADQRAALERRRRRRRVPRRPREGSRRRKRHRARDGRAGRSPAENGGGGGERGGDGTSRRRGRGRRERGDAVANPAVPTRRVRENIPKHVLDRFKDRPPGRESTADESHARLPAGFRGRRGFSRIPRRHLRLPRSRRSGRGAALSRVRAVPPSPGGGLVDTMRCTRRRSRRAHRGGWDPSECAVCAGTADVAFTRETLRCARALPVHPRCYGLQSAAAGGGGMDVLGVPPATEKGKANTPAVLAAAGGGAPRLGETLVRGKTRHVPRGVVHLMSRAARRVQTVHRRAMVPRGVRAVDARDFHPRRRRAADDSRRAADAS